MSDSEQHDDSFSGRMADAPETPTTPPTPPSTPPPPPPAPPVPEWQPGAGGPSGPRASFGRRLVALLLDLVLLSVVGGVVALIDVDIADLVALGVSIAYFSILNGGPRGQTIGKQVLGIRVVDRTTGGPIGYGRGVLRYFASWLSYIVCLLGYLWMLWDREKQCWHDKIASDFVVPVRYYPVN